MTKKQIQLFPFWNLYQKYTMCSASSSKVRVRPVSYVMLKYLPPIYYNELLDGTVLSIKSVGSFDQMDLEIRVFPEWSVSILLGGILVESS